jgi:hypothetical protein
MIYTVWCKIHEIIVDQEAISEDTDKIELVVAYGRRYRSESIVSSTWEKIQIRQH